MEAKERGEKGSEGDERGGMKGRGVGIIIVLAKHIQLSPPMNV